MILLHGAGGNSTQWAQDVITYASQYRVYAIDLPGEAGKSAANRPVWDSPAFAEWLEDVFGGLNIERATLVGNSQGGWMALKFAVAAPDRVDKLVLLAPGGIVPDRKSFLLRAIALMALGQWGTRKMVRNLFGDQKVLTGVIDIVAKMSVNFKPRIGVLPILTDEELRRLTMPILLLGGTKDIIRDTDQIVARLRDLVPNLTVAVIPGAGHALLNTSERVMEFLTAHENSTQEELQPAMEKSMS